MEIRNFTDTIRVGSGFPSSVDVTTLSPTIHESYGLITSSYCFFAEDETSFVQLRMDKQEHRVYMVCVKYGDLEDQLPQYIKESKIIYDSRNT